VINISAYRFAPLQDLKSLRERLLATCRECGLKGTILLSTEGINLFVAGLPEAVDSLLRLLRSVPGLEDLQGKVSESAEQPFTRMLVKIKKEIIAFGVPEVDPVRESAPRIAPQELKRWLDEGRPLTLLDTRNDFEVRLGTFERAQAIGIQHFREFPAAVDRLTLDRHSQPVVTFCTGGIRCEKAALYLMKQGYTNVYQLDGGILKYFEDCGNAHYIGDCFVFDKRVGVMADLDESHHGICFACQQLLTPEELASPLTVEGESCPYCYRTPEERQAESLAEHREKLKRVTSPLPGSVPQDNFRPLKIAARHDGWTILDFLCEVFPHIPRAEWLARCVALEIVDANRKPVSGEQVVRPGEYYATCERMHIEPDVNGNIPILYEDSALIVVNKPAPLPMHPSGRFHRNSLQWILCQVYAPQKPRPAHRLDANTTGLAVFTRTSTFAKRVQPQFERGEVQKQYLARVIGHPIEDRFSCDVAISASPAHAGSRTADVEGLPARTDFEVRSRDADGTSLLLVTPHTGRTNQIRIHLWHLGWPIFGDRMYRPDHQLGEVQTLPLDDEPLCLHAWRLQFLHPQSQQRVRFEAPRPQWAEEPAVRAT
jgi:RluA family pseudouridine synthase